MKLTTSRILVFGLPLATALALISLRVYAAQEQDRKGHKFHGDLRIEFGKDTPITADYNSFKHAVDRYSMDLPHDNARAHDLTYKDETHPPRKIPGGVDQNDPAVTAAAEPAPSASATASPTPTPSAIHVGQVVAFSEMAELKSFADQVMAKSAATPSPTPKGKTED